MTNRNPSVWLARTEASMSGFEERTWAWIFPLGHVVEQASQLFARRGLIVLPRAEVSVLAQNPSRKTRPLPTLWPTIAGCPAAVSQQDLAASHRGWTRTDERQIERLAQSSMDGVRSDLRLVRGLGRCISQEGPPLPPRTQWPVRRTRSVLARVTPKRSSMTFMGCL